MRKVLFLMLLAGSAVAAESTVKDVAVRQRWPWSNKVDIEFVLDGPSAQPYDVTLSFSNGGTPLSVPSSAITGSLRHLMPGLRRVVWDPSASGHAQTELKDLHVSVTAVEEPTYLIVDLTTGEKTYRSDLGLWEDVTNVVNKTDKMVFKRVRAGTFTMGSSALESQTAWMAPHQVTLTEDYWLGVFEVTQYQYNKLKGTWPSYSANVDDRACRPVETVSFSTVRGSSSAERFACTATSFIGILAEKAALRMDLPTEAQIEYAQRAGDQRSPDWYGGATTDAAADALMRFSYNGTPQSYKDLSDAEKRAAPISTGGTAEVGHYLPNAWGFYDLSGNVWEMTVDAFAFETGAVTDPYYSVGSGTKISIHGGCYTGNRQWCKNCARSNWGVSGTQNDIGFRVMAVIE